MADFSTQGPVLICAKPLMFKTGDPEAVAQKLAASGRNHRRRGRLWRRVNHNLPRRRRLLRARSEKSHGNDNGSHQRSTDQVPMGRYFRDGNHSNLLLLSA